MNHFEFLEKPTQQQRRRQRRDTYTSTDLILNPNSKGTTSSSPIPITNHLMLQDSHHSSSQPSTTGYRRIYSPSTLDTNSISHVQSYPRRYSASAAVSPPGHHHSLSIPPILNVIPPSPQQSIPREVRKKLINPQWHIPILLHACNKLRLSSTLLFTNEQLVKHMLMDGFIDCTKEDHESSSGITKTTAATCIQNVKPRKRGEEHSFAIARRLSLVCFSDNSRRHEEDLHLPHEKQIEDVRDSLDYAFATGKTPLSLFPSFSSLSLLAFYKNCLLELHTHCSDVDYALSTIYQEHYEDIDLTPFLKAMCSHLSLNISK